MLRFMFGLMAVVAVYLAWQWYSGDASKASERLFDTARGEAKPAPADGKPSPQAETPPVTPASASQSAEEALAKGVLSGDSEALAAGFRSLRGASGRGREQLTAALSAAVAGAKELDQLLVALGDGNAFLHSDVGRKAARKAVEKIEALEPADAVKRMSGLLEKCMRGPIAKGDVDAGAMVDEIYRHHRVLVDRTVFNPAVLTKARTHDVQSGETLDRIAATFRKQGINVEGWTLCFANRLGRPNRLRADVKLKIPIEPIHARVEKESFLMAVYVGETIVRLYWVAHGVDNKTPETTFTVSAKLADPDWYAPDGNVYPFGHPGNVLGRFFVKFEHESFTGFGAHGTNEPESIRTQASLGCIRMHDKDIEEFFRFVPNRAQIVIAASR